MLGTLLVPSGTQAGFLTSIFFGSEVSANVESSENLQTLALLEANAYSAPALKEKNTKTVDLPEDNGNVNILSGNALLPTAGPMAILSDVMGGADSDDEVYIYVVKQGDTVAQIAEMFEVSVNTILWANDMKKNDKLKEGEILFILPVSGVKHIVTKGQTLGSIAKMYKVDALTITGFNGISENAKLAIGDELIIPNGQMPNDDVPNAPRPTTNYYATSTLREAIGYFINPVPEFRRKSQGLHGPGRRGIDLAAPTGTKILASAEGKVMLARKGYNGGYGNMVIIEHPNGTKTLYAHLSKINTQTGAQVTQGELIGLVGSTGRSTGPHLHFEVFNAKNPGSDWSWALSKL